MGFTNQRSSYRTYLELKQRENNYGIIRPFMPTHCQRALLVRREGPGIQ
jgi:hypothetical protein